MIKKCLLSIVFLFLLSCSNRDRIMQMFEIADQHPNKAVCFRIYLPKDLAGRYCVIRTNAAPWEVGK